VIISTIDVLLVALIVLGAFYAWNKKGKIEGSEWYFRWVKYVCNSPSEYW
jgi:hypothetical protein